MSTTTTLPHGDVQAKASPRSNPARFLYAGVSTLLFVLTFLGFQQFYLHGNAVTGHPLFPPVSVILMVHGIAMTGWMVLFLLQPFLVATNNRRAHMSLGIVGAILAAAIVVLSIWAAIATTRAEPEFIRFGLSRKQFMAIQLLLVLSFGGFVALGVRNRRQAAIHRPMMLLATLSIIPAAIDRIPGVPELWGPTIWGHLFGPLGSSLVIGVVFLAVKCAVTRSFDRWLAGGLAALAVVGLLMMKLATSAFWESVAGFLTS